MALRADRNRCCKQASIDYCDLGACFTIVGIQADSHMPLDVRVSCPELFALLTVPDASCGLGKDAIFTFVTNAAKTLVLVVILLLN